jgi:multidrug efflux system membrane fusion protein
MRRRLLITGAAVVILGGAVAGFVLTRASTGNRSAANPGLPPATARVTRTTLVETKTVSGTLGYGDPVPVRTTQRGTLTWIAPLGSAVKRGSPLFKVDERPVVALYGSLPLYRPLREGTAGRDVRQLKRNLAALGYTGFTVDDTDTAATAAAVRSWQAKHGLAATGTIEPGQVVFTPGPVRIAEQTARVGDIIGRDSGGGGGSLLSYTSTARQVTVDLDVADEPLAIKGRPVTVTVPNGGTVKGRISQLGTVATTQNAGSNGASSARDSSDSGSSAPAGAGSAASNARIEVTVTIADQKSLGSLQGATVDVDFVSAERKNVLAVPVAALLALPRGGFGVQVVKGEATRIVPVRTGTFAGGQVEVSGQSIAEGTRVASRGD